MSERKIQVRKNGLRLTWTEDELNYVFSALAEGKSAGVIARDMTKAGMRSDCGPITRNAVVGIWNRYPERRKLCPKKSKKKEVIPNPSYETRAEQAKRTVKALKISPPIMIPEDGITFDDLKNDSCRFIYGDLPSQNIRYCGHPIDFNKGRSLCAMHYALCYVPPRKS